MTGYNCWEEGVMVHFEFRANSNYINADIVINSTKVDLGLLNKEELKDLASDLIDAVDSISYYITAEGFDERLSEVNALIEHLI